MNPAGRGMAGAPPLPKSLFDFGDGPLWVAHCAIGPVPRAAVRAVREHLEREARPWEISREHHFVGLPQRVRHEGARLFGGDAGDIALVPTTSAGLSRIAAGIDWRPGDEVLLPLGEFPANVWPWKALAPAGVSVREVPLWPGHRAGREAWATEPPPPGCDPEQALLDAISPATRLVSASWVRFQDGLVLDLARLGRGCAERNVPLVADAIQGAGTLPWPGGASAAACGGHKGLLAPQGLGLLWTEPSFRASLRPTGSWLSVEDAGDFARPVTDTERAWLEDGRRFEQGVPNLVGCAALAASLALVNDAGPERIAGHVRRLQRHLLGALADLPAWRDEAQRLLALLDEGRLGSILALHHRGRGARFLEETLERGRRLGVAATLREGYLRIAFHGWHDEEDVERIAAWLG
ncbi:MAG: aminotransferase class V-fold PLP-dependent enzyme [Acidobacteria bacterium]|nr:MAG: aminotransferase class V-fold PLP-dependent enzyme [Acidobacteriota bacterium]